MKKNIKLSLILVYFQLHLLSLFSFLESFLPDDMSVFSCSFISSIRFIVLLSQMLYYQFLPFSFGLIHVILLYLIVLSIFSNLFPSYITLVFFVLYSFSHTLYIAHLLTPSYIFLHLLLFPYSSVRRWCWWERTSTKGRTRRGGIHQR